MDGDGPHGQYHTHTRDGSQQSQQSLHSFASATATTELSAANISSSSEDFNDYASPSTTQMNKMWNNNGHYSNKSNGSNSTSASIGNSDFSPLPMKVCDFKNLSAKSQKNSGLNLAVYCIDYIKAKEMDGCN